MFTAGEWYFTRLSRRIVYLRIVAGDKAWAEDVEHPGNRGWVYLRDLDPKNQEINTEYNTRRWQPRYPDDEYLEN